MFKIINLKWNLIIKVYCLLLNDTENIYSKVWSTSNGKYYQNVQYLAVQNQDLLKIQNHKGY